MRALLNKWFIFLIIFLVLGSGFFYLFERGEKIIQIESGKENPGDVLLEELTPEPDLNTSPLSGLACENYNRRPFAVILAEDSVARPLSGISMADLAIEMPVITGGITRIMAVFQCQSPEEIGSLRSARHDFIPLAMGLDAILVHWGGSHYALDLLKKKIVDNLDALVGPGQAFWRKKGISPPHNGFTSMENLIETAQKIGYRLESNFEGYSHIEKSKISRQSPAKVPPQSRYSPATAGSRNMRDGIPQITPTADSAKGGNAGKNQKSKIKGVLKIDYPYPYNVRYEYEPETNSYLRWRSGRPEIDRLNAKQVEAKNVVIMRASSRQLEKEYNDVDIEGGGQALFYRNGEEIEGKWQKDKSIPTSKLYFYDASQKEVEFMPGAIWIEIVEPHQQVNWK